MKTRHRMRQPTGGPWPSTTKLFPWAAAGHPTTTITMQTRLTLPMEPRSTCKSLAPLHCANYGESFSIVCLAPFHCAFNATCFCDVLFVAAAPGRRSEPVIMRSQSQEHDLNRCCWHVAGAVMRQCPRAPPSLRVRSVSPLCCATGGNSTSCMFI